MEESVCVIVGEWGCASSGVWKFVPKLGELARCVTYCSETTFSEVESRVGNIFNICHEKTTMSLSFCSKEEAGVMSQGKMPPVGIKAESEWKQFKELKKEIGGLYLYLTVKDVCANEDEGFFSDDFLVAYVDHVEAVHKARMSKEVEHGGGGVEDIVDNRKRKNGEDYLLMGKKKKSNHVVSLEENNFDNRDEEEEDEITMALVDMVVDKVSTEEDSIGGVDKDTSRCPFEINMSTEVSVEVNESAGAVTNANIVDEGQEDEITLSTVIMRADNITRKEQGTNESDEYIVEVDSPDYNYDEWTDRINEDYPPEWDPFVGNEETTLEAFYEVGETSGDREVEAALGLHGDENLVEAPVREGNIDQLRSAVVVHGDDNWQEATFRSCGTPVMEEHVEQLRSAVVVHGDVNFVEQPVIDESDPLLLNDAPPCPDNMRGLPSHERNMDLKRAADAIYVGRIFANKADMYEALSLYAMKRIFCYKIVASDKTRVIAACVDKNCGWRVYAVTHPKTLHLEVRTVTMKHECDVAARSRYGSKATAKILAGLLKGKFANGKRGPRACELPEMVLSELNVTISYMKAWNAKELAVNATRGTEEGNYEFLATYLHLVKLTNPGTITEIETTVDKKGKTLFKYLFFAFGACIDGYKHLRKVIVIDGTAMKGKYKGCLVAASGQDGNMQIYPLAFGVVEVENDAGWTWFFKNLLKFVPDEEDLVFVSDRHASIYSALGKVYPLAHHVACSVHLFRNVKHNYGCGGLAGLVSKAGRAYTVGDFRYWWRQIEETNPECAEYLLNIGLPHWTLSHFTGDRYNLMSSNISESLNAAMKKAVEYPIVSMVEFIRAMLMRWFWCRRTFAAKIRTKCTPEIEELLIDHLKESLNCAVNGATDWIYQVNDEFGCEFTVDLEKKTCTCRVFDVLKIPCCHALAASRVRNVDPYSLISQCYFVGPWREKYKGVLMPRPNEKDCDIPVELTEVPVNPPRTKRGGGRPKKKRIPSQGEVHHKKKRVTKCGRCFKPGHNRKTCSTLI